MALILGVFLLCLSGSASALIKCDAIDPACFTGGTGTVTSLTEGTGIDLTPNTITTTGSIGLADTAVTPGTYGTASTVVVVTIDQQGRITAASTVAISGLTNSAIAGGANIDAAKLGTGVVSTTEFNFLDGVTSAIQGQLDGKQPLDADLTALAALSSTGIIVRTAADTYVLRTLAAPAQGFTITAPDGVSGNPTFVLANDLAALEALTGAGYARRTGVDTWTLDATATATPHNLLSATHADTDTGTPPTTKGDLISWDSGLSKWVVLPRGGTAGQVLAINASASNTRWRLLNSGSPGLTVDVTSDPSITWTLDADLDAVAALSGTGLATRTGAGTWTTRTITGSNGVTVTNGDGVSGNPALSAPFLMWAAIEGNYGGL